MDERKAYLNRLLATGDTMLYRYDLGDNWEHLITNPRHDDARCIQAVSAS